MASPNSSRPALDPAVKEAMHQASREKIRTEGSVAELFHVVLAAIVVLLVMDRVPTALLATWFVLLSAAVAWRWALRRDLDRHALDLPRRRRFRTAVTALGLIWGVGAGLFVPWLPFRHVALLLVIVSGMVATATWTLAADTLGFRAFLLAALAPLAVGIAATPFEQAQLAALALIVLFAAVMLVLQRRAHVALVQQMTANVQLVASEAQAAGAHARLRALFASAPVATAVVNAAGIVEDVNPRFESLFGYAAAETRGRPLNDLIVPAGERNHARQLDGTVLGGEPVVVEARRRRKNGELVPVRASAARIEGTGQAGLFVLYEDISEEVAARAALEHARDVAEKVAQMRSAFLANMSHEIRTPMNAVLGLAELLLDADLDPEQRRLLALIQSSGETLLTLLNDILDLSKIEAEGLHLEEVTFDLPHLVDSTVTLMAVKARDRKLELLSDVAEDVPEQVRGDPTRLRQVLTNLIGNALKFTHEGEVAVSVRLANPDGVEGSLGSGNLASGNVAGGGGWPASGNGGGSGVRRVCFSVRDTGIGIPEDQREAIFQPFSQADLSMTRKYGGTGLGLTIARRLVEMMGGTLEVASEVGRGSEFSFTVGFAVEAAPAPAVLPAPDMVAVAGLRMLVVDDNQSNRGIVRGLLGAVGVTVEEAGSTDEGLAAMRAAAAAGAPFAVAILDAQMPGRDGFELAREARADPALAATRLLMLTSAGQRGDAQRCRELGIRGYLTKPVSRADLLDMVTGVLAAGEEGGGAAEVVTRHRIQESRRRLRVLLAEDNAVNQEVAAAMLRKRGHQVVVVGTGRAALEMVRHEPFDVILMDMQMPEMDGLEATRAIRALEGGAGAALPIIALTAHALPEERERCLAAGMNACVTKPFKAFELFAAAEGLTARRPEAMPVPGAAASAMPPAAREPPATPGSSPGPPVAFETFRKEMVEAGAGAVVPTILAGYLESAEGRIAEIATAASAGDAGEVARLAHTLRSSSAQLGARRLAELLTAMETAAREQDLETVRRKSAVMVEEGKAVVEYLKQVRV